MKGTASMVPPELSLSCPTLLTGTPPFNVEYFLNAKVTPCFDLRALKNGIFKMFPVLDS